jgi:hypothetical protein
MNKYVRILRSLIKQKRKELEYLEQQLAKEIKK